MKQVREDLLFFALFHPPEKTPKMKFLLLKIKEQPLLVRLLGAILLLHLVLWTLVPDLLYSVLPLDSLEAVAWGSGFSLGNAKHPPLTGWVAGLTAGATGHADWPIYLLSQICVAGGMACIYLLAREFFGREESALAALSQEFVLYYNVTSPEFNVNMPMLLLWPAAALFFVRAYRRDMIRDWILLGIACGLCFLCKYYSALLFAAFGVFLLISKERRWLFLGAGPWIAAGAFFVVILPHAMWALTGGLAMMEAYVEKRMTAGGSVSWFRRHILNVLTILGNAVMVFLIPYVAFRVSKREKPRVPSVGAGTRREALVFAVTMIGVPLSALTVIGLSGGNIRAMWLDPLFFSLGILMVSLFPAEWTANQQKWFRIATLFAFSLAITYVTVAGIVHTTHRKSFPAKDFTKKISAMYSERTGKPLEIVAGNAWTAGMFRQYAPGHPQGCIIRNRSELERLGPMLKERGGLAVSDKEEDIDSALELFGSPASPQISYTIEFRSLLGKKRVRSIHLAILEGTPSK